MWRNISVIVLPEETYASLREIVPTMKVGGHSIYKSTFISQLNGNVFLSNDKLARIKQSIQFNNYDNRL